MSSSTLLGIVLGMWLAQWSLEFWDKYGWKIKERFRKEPPLVYDRPYTYQEWLSKVYMPRLWSSEILRTYKKESVMMGVLDESLHHRR